ncbi:MULTISPECIES: TIR domain-containing protein [Bacteroides]|uniref:TIR domain-containing protein n=1 Tax=Bacteroides TaxID=816 RepID=UPI00189EFF85|nr:MULTISPECIES: TIR domain-containing protein [Bacteroides]MDC2614060.1 TIR domain-containing protein [Bacteroides ovatus]MDC2633401.1 TIR domain-containing protein [Bacteroides ovatus]
MGRKVFVSYKYKDEQVAKLQDAFYEEVNSIMKWNYRRTRVRDYVDYLQEKIGRDHINLGEKDGESLDDFADSTIETSLKKKIAQSSITIVLISKGMKTNEVEKNQWIPWEVSYSLRTVPTSGNTKQMNAVLGIILPDETNTYDWYYTSNPNCNSVTHHTKQLFKILKNNMFNIKEKEFRECNGSKIHITDEPSFIKTVKWDNFIDGDNYNYYIDKSIEIRNSDSLYDICINLD